MKYIIGLVLLVAGCASAPHQNKTQDPTGVSNQDKCVVIVTMACGHKTMCDPTQDGEECVVENWVGCRNDAAITPEEFELCVVDIIQADCDTNIPKSCLDIGKSQ